MFPKSEYRLLKIKNLNINAIDDKTEFQLIRLNYFFRTFRSKIWSMNSLSEINVKNQKISG